MSLSQKLLAIPKFILYFILLLLTSIPLFINLPVPNVPSKSTVDLFANLMLLEEGSTVLIASDWTNSTRGESKPALAAVVKILIRKGVKFALYSTADPQAPTTAEAVIREVAKDELKPDGTKFEPWIDYISMGFFPNSEVSINGIGRAFADTVRAKRTTDSAGKIRGVLDSPVLAGKTKVEDFAILIGITASKTSDQTVERIFPKTKLAFLVTGVMAPETEVYYNSGQFVGFSGGLKGVYDMEMLLESGLKGDPKWGDVPGFPGKKNAGLATKFYPALQFAVVYLVILVILGNIGMFLGKKEAKK